MKDGYRLIIVTNVPLCGEGDDKGGGYASVRQGAYGKSLYVPLNFAVTLKLL